jgi:DNA-binding MarR family transcriptional regulator
MIQKREFRSHDKINDAYVYGLLEHARSLITRARELELAQHGITREQMSILHAILINDGSATIEEIASFIIRQHNSVSTIVSRMSKLGLVKKEKLPHEKKYLVLVTEKAKKIVDSMPWKSIELIFAGLSLNEKQQLATYLEHLVSTGHEIMGHNFTLPFLSPEESTGYDSD